MAKTIDRAYRMHKDRIVLDLEINESGGIRVKRVNAAEQEHIPIGGMMNNMRLLEWWKDISLFSNTFEDYFGGYTFDSGEKSDMREKTGFFPAS